MKDNYQKAITLDSNDSLKKFRDKFVIDPSVIYLDGNSLGRLPKNSIELISNIVKEQWGNRLIRSWNEHWIDLSNNIAKKIAIVVGANEDEIFVGDTTSLNLYKLAFAALSAQKGKTKILSDDLNFPTDLYILEGLIKHQFQNHSLELITSKDGMTISNDQLAEQIDDQTALLTLSHVTYKSAFMYDMEAVNKLAKAKDTLVVWDLSHSAGAVPIQLNQWQTDMAIGCTYKYLNGGPGALAFLYVSKALQEQLKNPITSWFSHQKPFDFDLHYKANQSIQKFAISTPSVLSLAPIECGLDITIEAKMESIREKSSQQSEFMMELITQELIPLGFSIASPKEISHRGSHISIQHEEAYRINRALIEPNDSSIKIIIPDFRPPNNIRLGIAPLYNSYLDIYESIQRIKAIVIDKEFERFDEDRLMVT